MKSIFLPLLCGVFFLTSATASMAAPGNNSEGGVAANNAPYVTTSTTELRTIEGELIGTQTETIQVKSIPTSDGVSGEVTDIKTYVLQPGMESYSKIYTYNTNVDVITTKNDGSVYLNNVKVEDTQIQTRPGIQTREAGGDKGSCYYDNYSSTAGGTFYAASYQHYDYGPTGNNVSKYFSQSNSHASDYKMYVNSFSGSLSSLKAFQFAAQAAGISVVISLAAIPALIVSAPAFAATIWGVYNSNRDCDSAINNAYQTLSAM